jgi:mannose-6-phosphate isomerase-like protein (cupin superfamily)
MADEFFFDVEGCYITELSNNDDDPGLSIARARVEPGVTTRWHRLAETTERYCILSGTGLAEVGELAPAPVSAGDVVIIPPMERQRIQNNGTEDLIFLAICTPRFETRNYKDG